MTKEELIVALNPRIAEEFELDEEVITPDAPIIETLDLDSISLIDLVGVVQTMYRVKIEKDDLEKIKTFDDLYNFILDKQA